MGTDIKIIICNNSNKKYILKRLSREKKLYNLKFYTFYDLKKKLFWDYDNKTIEYIMINYKVSLDIAKIYLDNLYFLKEVDIEKISFLNGLKKDLDNKGLLVYDEYFKDYIKDKEVILYGYEDISLEEEYILEQIPNIKKYEGNKKENNPIVYQLGNLKEEVLYVMNRISKLYLDGVSLNNIKIIIPDNYINILKFYSEVFRIPFNFRDTHSFYSTALAEEFLREYDNYILEENIERLKDKYKNINDLITIINKSVLVDSNLRREFIINDLKHVMVKEIRYKEGVEVVSWNEYFDDSYYVFLLGFHIGNYPKIYKDDNYLNDKELEILGLDTSITRNRLEKRKVIKKLKEIKNLVITCCESDDKTIFPSLLIEEMNLKLEKGRLDVTNSYSRLATKLQYASDLDNLYKFNVVSDNLGLYRKSNLNLEYLEYDNKFKGINNETLKSRINKELNLSYTSMEMYNECAFKYYISKILRLDRFQDSFKTILGTITHHILELGLTKDIDIKVEIMKFIKEKSYELDAREYFYLEKLNKELEFILKVLKEQENNSGLDKYLFETNLSVYLDKEDINVTFKGLIDKVMYTEIDGKEILAVVDYKTGNPLITLDNLKYGLNIQLPIYLYLLKKSERFKEAIIAGFYIQKVIGSIPNIDKNKSLEDIKKDNLKLQGFSNSSSTILEILDKEYNTNSMINGLRMKKDGSFYNNAKVLNNIEMEEITEQVDKEINRCIENILDGNFDINPKVLKGDNISCEFCKFKDICFKTKKDEIVLGGEEDELDRGTVGSNN